MNDWQIPETPIKVTHLKDFATACGSLWESIAIVSLVCSDDYNRIFRGTFGYMGTGPP